MKVLNLLSSGGVGGIEQLCKNLGIYAEYDNSFCFLFEEGKVYEEMKKKSEEVFSFVDKKHGKFTRKRWNSLCKLASGYDIITVHHCTIALQIYYILLRQKYKDKKFVMTMHSCFEEEQNYNYGSKIKNECAKWALKKALSVSDKIIFVSEAGRKSYLNSFDIDRKKTAVIYNGVESHPKTKNSDIRDYIRLTYIGRLEKIKGVDLFLISVRKILDMNFAIRVWIIGDGTERKHLEKMVYELELKEVVEFLGIQRDIGKYLQKTDLFVYPSVCEEVFGISIVEAMSYGVPCVSNRVGGIPEIIDDGVNGFITDEKTGNGICNAIERFLIEYNSGLLEPIKDACVKTAERFSVQTTVKQLRNIYEALLK